MNPPRDNDLLTWHRYFAIEANNSAWKQTLDHAEVRNVLNILAQAYVASYHWSQCGTELNVFRANVLLAHAHAYCGHGATALEYVERYRAYMQNNPVEGWERPFASMIQAQAAFVVGDFKLHAEMYAEAADLIDGITDPGDREVIEMTWANIPRP
ncbi:MAG: hypothetical protein FGM32_10585 [Candidatus Kapabacteria bacterium]|nr:hypothetical protein [Candidatus Kapabacteria bacterium]